MRDSVDLEVEGKPGCFLIDTGASVSIIRAAVLKGHPVTLGETRREVQSLSGHALPVIGVAHVAIKIGRRVVNHEFLVSPGGLELGTDGLLGTDFLAKHQAMISVGGQWIHVAGSRIPLRPGIRLVAHAKDRVNPEGRVGISKKGKKANSREATKERESANQSRNRRRHRKQREGTRRESRDPGLASAARKDVQPAGEPPRPKLRPLGPPKQGPRGGPQLRRQRNGPHHMANHQGMSLGREGCRSNPFEEGQRTQSPILLAGMEAMDPSTRHLINVWSDWERKKLSRPEAN